MDLANVPDTYIEPFTAYRAWNWDSEGITSLNNARWTPKQAFEAVCRYDNHDHLVPDPSCTCGMYAGINMAHLIEIGYIQHGIHGEVSLWGRLYRHTLGWRAQYAYPKNFIVPANMVPFKLKEAQERLQTLVEFDVDIYLQTGNVAKVGQEVIPLWIRDYGYSQQGLSFLVEKRKKWYDDNPNVHVLKVGDRVAVYSDLSGGGIGIVHEIAGDEAFFKLFAPDVIYHKPVKEIKWSEHNWRWETTGLGASRRLR